MRRTLASWAILLGVVAFVCLPLAALAQRRGGVPFGLNWNRGKPASSALLSMSLTGNCEGTTPAGLTFTRTSTATCTRADGSLTTVASGQPRLESQGLLVEGAATNLALRSGEVDVAPWAGASGVVAAPVTTANAGPARDGTTSAERLDFPAVVGAGAHSARSQSLTMTAAAHTFSADVQGASGGGRLYLYGTPDGVGFISAPCDFAAGAPTRCTVTGTPTATSWNWRIGVDLRDATQSAQGAQSVYVWGAQLEAGPVATSYIPTAGTQVTRQADVASGAWPAGMTDGEGCVGAFVTAARDTGMSNVRVVDVANGTPIAFVDATGANLQAWDGTSAITPLSTGATFKASPADVVATWKTGVGLTLAARGLSASGAYDGTMLGAAWWLGSDGGTTTFLNGWLRNVRFGATPGACQ